MMKDQEKSSLVAKTVSPPSTPWPEDSSSPLRQSGLGKDPYDTGCGPLIGFLLMIGAFYLTCRLSMFIPWWILALLEPR